MWFVHHPEIGFEFYETKAQAYNRAKELSEVSRVHAENRGHWRQDMERICFGKMYLQAKPVSFYDEDGIEKIDYQFMDCL